MASSTSGDSEGQGMLECCSPWGCKESDTTERLNNSNILTDTRSPVNVYGQRLEPGNKYGQAGVVSSMSACQATQTIISKTDWLHPSWGFIYFQQVCAYKNIALQPKRLFQSQRDSTGIGQNPGVMFLSFFVVRSVNSKP